MNPKDCRYSKSHIWVKAEGSEATIGLTEYAQEQLGNILFVEATAEVGDSIGRGKPCGTVESDKATSDVISPVSGEVLAVNEDVVNAPETINEDPYGAGWLLRARLSNPRELDELMSAEEFDSYIAESQ